MAGVGGGLLVVDLLPQRANGHAACHLSFGILVQSVDSCCLFHLIKHFSL